MDAGSSIVDHLFSSTPSTTTTTTNNNNYENYTDIFHAHPPLPSTEPSSSSQVAETVTVGGQAEAIDEEPLYVNAKQYFRILKRRVARARLEEVHRLYRQRKVRLSACLPCRRRRLSYVYNFSLICMSRDINMR